MGFFDKLFGGKAASESEILRPEDDGHASH